MSVVGSGEYIYERIDEWAHLPTGLSMGQAAGVVVDGQGRVFVAHRGNPPILIFDQEGALIGAWGSDLIHEAHQVALDGQDVVLVTDRAAHAVVAFSDAGEPLWHLGTPGIPSATGCAEDAGPVPQPAGPFNRPTKAVRSPTGDLFASDGYRNCRVHRFAPDGTLLTSWGVFGKISPGAFHLPHSVAVDRHGRVYVCDRENSRIQIFSADGAFLQEWTDLYRPTDVYMASDGVIYVSELFPRVTVLALDGAVLSRWEAPPSSHGIALDDSGNIYIAQVRGQRVTKYRRV